MRASCLCPSLVILLALTTLSVSTAGARRTQDAHQASTQTTSSTSSWLPVIEAARRAVVVIQTDKAQGSGFLMKSDGTIATNAHVIAGASAIEVKLATGEIYRRVYVLTSDETEDIAMLRIEAVDLPSLPLGNSNDVKVGDDVLLIGAPLGLEETVSTGIVSAVRLSDTGERMFQTTAAASPGSSGGPLLNNRGEVVGLISSSIRQGQSLNFAIPINYVRGKLETLTLSGGAQVVDSSGKPIPGSSTRAGKHPGVLLAGLSGPGTPQGSFEFIFVQLLDFLSGKGVDMMTQTASFSPTTTQLVSLNYYLQNMSASGALGLLYVTVERPVNFKYIIRIQCFDTNGKLLWEEKEGHAGWSESGGTNGALEKIEKKLQTHIGSAGLPLKQEK